MTNKDWFESWFDSPYYHILYKNRSDEEAAMFIHLLTQKLALSPASRIWDLCCGKGRHSIHLNKLGYHAVGTDLAENSIRQAKTSENDTLEFYVHDMRTPFRIHYFDAVFNLFTSFGYFERENDHKKVCESVYQGLKDRGIFVIDYFNAIQVASCMIPEESKTIQDITFHLTKKITDHTIIKDIRFKDKGREYHFTENVKLFKKEDFLRLVEPLGFKLLYTFGDYHLNEFNESQSPRLILVLTK